MLFLAVIYLQKRRPVQVKPDGKKLELIFNYTFHRSNQSKQTDNKADGAKSLKQHPLPRPRRNPILQYVHLHRKINSQRPEIESPQDSEHLVEVREEYSDDCGCYHVDSSESEPGKDEVVWFGGEGHRDWVYGVYKISVRVFLGEPDVCKCEYGLTVYLIPPNQVKNNAGICEVDEPERFIETEPGE